MRTVTRSLYLVMGMILLKTHPSEATFPPQPSIQVLPEESAPLPAERLRKKQKITIEQLTSIFENSETDFQYDYIQDIDDGAGVTTGRVGFNTNAGDLLEVVNRYMTKKPDSPLGNYVPCLKNIVRTSSYACLFPSVDATTLARTDFRMGKMQTVDFGKAWTDAARDKKMQQIQDGFVEEKLFKPAVEWASRLGLKSALARALIYDTVVQMDQLPEMAKFTRDQFAQSHAGRKKPETPAEELEWMTLYQAERKTVLCRTAVGCTTLDRVDSLNQIIATKNLDLILPLTITYDDDPFTLK